MSQDEDDRKQVGSLSVDEPIKNRSGDKLGRAGFAESLANQIAATGTDGSFVVGLLGPWGSGKTSILNMVHEILANRSDVAVVRFNPWLFSGSEQLIHSFFSELASQLGETGDERLSKLGRALVDYADLVDPLRFIPGFGIFLGVAKATGGYLARRGRTSAEAQRRNLDQALRAQSKRVVVVIDDIDRLRREEIRDVMRLVRLVADFPRTAYLLAFDRRRVEEALTEVEGDGRAYLEKILQVTHDVPTMHEPDLAGLILSELGPMLDGMVTGPFNQVDWDNVFNLVIRPLFRTVRDARRYLNALPLTLEIVSEEVALVDVLALEAIRVLLPDVFAKLPEAFPALTTPASYIGGDPSSHYLKEMKDRVDALINAGGSQSTLVREMIVRLFPASRRYLDNHHYGPEWFGKWRRERRVANPDVFRFYLEKKLPDGTLPAHMIEKIFQILGSEEALTKVLSSCDSATLEHIMKRLEDYEDEFRPNVVEPAVRVLLNQSDRLREGRTRFDDYGSDLQLRRIILRLLRRIESDSVRVSTIKQILPGLTSLSARYALIELVGHQQNVGHRLISDEDSSRLEEELRRDLLNESATVLADERALPELLGWVMRTQDPSAVEFVQRVVRDDHVLLRLLRGCLTEGQARTVGDVAVRTELRLPWDWLASILGEDGLRDRVRELWTSASRDELEERTVAALDLAKRYADGWRPGSPSA